MASQRESSPGSALRPLPVPRHRRTHPLTAAHLPERVLIAYDGRSKASGALAMGADVAAVAGSDLIVATVESEAARRALPDLESAARECLGDRSFRVITKRSESVPAGLQSIAEETVADLMVLGSTRQTGLRRMFPGSVGERVLNRAPCAIGVAPPGHTSRDAGLQVVGVGYDGSPESIAALRLGTAIASAGGGVLRILTVAEPMGSLLFGLRPEEARAMVREGFFRKRHRRWMRDRLDEALLQVLWEIALEGRLVEGSADATLRREAERGLDLLVLGSRGGYGPARRVLLGSVAAAAMREASCPTIVVPRP